MDDKGTQRGDPVKRVARGRGILIKRCAQQTAAPATAAITSELDPVIRVREEDRCASLFFSLPPQD